jgi:hypothetical protein
MIFTCRIILLLLLLLLPGGVPVAAHMRPLLLLLWMASLQGCYL